MGDKELDVDQFRNSHESSTEWRLRRQFLLAHRDKFTVDRLLCLASCYVNVECYGNRYPDPVMRQLRELKADLPRDNRECFGKNELGGSKLSYHKRNEVKFVKSTEQCGSHVSEPGTSPQLTKVIVSTASSLVVTQNNAKDSPLTSARKLCITSGSMRGDNLLDRTKSPEQNTSGTTVTQSESHEQLQQNKPAVQQQDNSEQLKKFYTLSNHIRALYSKGKNAVEVLHMAADKCRMLVNAAVSLDITGYYHCMLELDFVFVCLGKAVNKKAAKHNAFQHAIELFWKPYLNIDNKDPNKPRLESSDKPFQPSDRKNETVSGLGTSQPLLQNDIEEEPETKPTTGTNQGQKRKVETLLDDLSDFLIFEHRGAQNPVSILHNSAAVNKKQMQVEFLNQGLLTRCQLYMNGHLIADEVAQNKAEAKTKACERGLRFLKTVCWTIQNKASETADEADVTREQLLGSIRSDMENDQISDSNIGKRLLEKMGWKGGGLGKEGNEGIREPIAAEQVISRAGLGLQAEQGISQQFLPKVKQLIQDYCLSGNEKDLVFSPFFSKDERAIIHREAQKMNLKSHSCGHGSERYIVLTRKRTVTQLFSHVLRSGGETSKYVLIPPSPNQT